MIGVNCWNHDPVALKEVMTQEKLNWRSFADQGAIAHQWNNPATPSYYVMDHKRTIRHKWVGNPGGKSLDNALKKLIQEAMEPPEKR